MLSARPVGESLTLDTTCAPASVPRFSRKSLTQPSTPYPRAVNEQRKLLLLHLFSLLLTLKRGLINPIFRQLRIGELNLPDATSSKTKDKRFWA